MNSARIFFTAMMAVVLALSSVSLAIVPAVIGFQGRLVDSAGGQPPDDGYEITFSMWDDPTGGIMLWSETQQVEVLNGQFEVELGSENDIPTEQLSLNFEKIYFQTEVLGDVPMMPRIPLSSVPYSLVSSRLQGDVLTGPGTLSVGLEQPSFKWAELSGSTSEARLSLGEPDQEQLSLTAGDQGSHYFMVDSFFDVEYRIELSTTNTGGTLTVSNIGSSGEDGVSIDVDPDASHLIVSNIGSSGQDGVTIGVDDGSATCGIEHEDIGGSVAVVSSSAGGSGGTLVVSNIGSSGQDGVTIGAGDNSATCGIEHEDIGGAVSFANSSADASGGGHEVGHNLSQYQFSTGGIGADGSGAGLNLHGQFDMSSTIAMNASDSGGYFDLGADDGLSISKRSDRATPQIYESLCKGEAAGSGQTLRWFRINPTSGEEYFHYIPEIGDEVLAGFKADNGGALFYANDSFFDIDYRLDLGTQGLAFTRFRPDGTPVRAAEYTPNSDFIVDSFFDVDYRVSRSVDTDGAHLDVSNIGSSGQDGFSLLSSDSRSGLTIKEGGNNRISLYSNGSTDRLTLGDLDSDGSLDLVAGTTGGDLSVFFQGPTGEDVVRVSAGNGDGARLALGKTPLGEPVPIEIVALSLVSTEPIITVRNPNYLPTDPPVLDWFYDPLYRMTLTLRDSETAPGESTKTSTDGFHIFDGPNQLHFDTRGLLSFGPTGPIFSITPSGEFTTPATVTMAYDPAGLSQVGIGTLAPTEKLYVDGNICATGFIGPCSDARYKKNVQSIDGALDIVSNLRGVRFEWRTDEFPDKHFSDKSQVGLIAQEVDMVVPEVVSQGTDGYYSVDYSRLAPILIEAVKEQQKTIETLQTKLRENDNLRAEVNELREIVRQLVLETKNDNSGTEVKRTAD